MTAARRDTRREHGRLDDGTAWSAAVPATWDGILVSDADLTDQPSHARIDDWYLAEGMAVLRTSREPAAWQVDRMLENRHRVHDEFAARFGAPATVVATGESLGGMVSRAIAEREPELAHVAVAMNGGGSGTIGLWNAKQDAGFALRVLVARGAPTALPEVLARAETTAEGRARATLAAAFAMQPTWSDPDTPRPAPADLEAQAAVMRSALGFGLAPAIRAEVERLAGGVFSGNEGVEYRALAQRLGHRLPIVERAYERAGISLDADLRVLDAADRVATDPAAVAWAQRGEWSGTLAMPLVTVYAIGDPAAVPEEEGAYRVVAEIGGGAALLEEHYLDAAGHCRFTTGERAVAVRRALALLAGDGSGTAPAPKQLGTGQPAPEQLVAEAGAIDERDRAAGGAVRPPAFVAYAPGPYVRPFEREA